MADNNSQLRASIKAALASFQNKTLADAATGLLDSLGYSSDKIEEFASKPAKFITEIEEATSTGTPFQRDRIHLEKWKECAFLFQLTNDEIPSLAIGQKILAVDSKVQRQQLESFVYALYGLTDEEIVVVEGKK